MTSNKWGIDLLPTTPSSADIDVWISGRTISVEFYMPKEPETTQTGPTTTTGDRLMTGDKIMTFGTGTTSTSLGSDLLTEECNTTGVTLTLGSISLIASSLFVFSTTLGI
jgi:hypothetical protein